MEYSHLGKGGGLSREKKEIKLGEEIRDTL